MATVTDAPDRPKQRKGYPWSGQHDHSHPVIAVSLDQRTLGERVADSVARFGGSWPFIFSFLALILSWMVLNTVVIDDVMQGKPFDPFPYIALNLVLSALAGLQAPIIMMSQNRAAARDEALAATHYKETMGLDTPEEKHRAHRADPPAHDPDQRAPAADASRLTRASLSLRAAPVPWPECSRRRRPCRWRQPCPPRSSSRRRHAADRRGPTPGRPRRR